MPCFLLLVSKTKLNKGMEGKPVDMAEKIAIGRLNKFFADSTLLNQQFIKDNKLKH